MIPRQQSDPITFRLIVIRRRASEILLSPNWSGWALPCVQVFPQERVAQQLTAELTRQLGLQAYCLFTSSSAATDGTARPAGYAVMECVMHNGNAPKGTNWMPRNGFACQRIHPVEDRDALAESLRELDSYENEPTAGPFGRPGWLRELFDWAQEQLSPLGLRVNGSFLQFNAGPTFSLLRLETNGPAVWFKATGKPNLHELPITLSLTRLFPGYLPAILGVHPSWNAWLSLEISSTTLDQVTDLSAVGRVAEDLAELQIASIGKCCELIDAQCKDLRLPKLIELIPFFLARVTTLMTMQEKPCPPALSIRELDFLGERLQEAISILQDLRFPDTLGHSDLNPGNIVVSSAHCVFLDWAEACVTNPLITFEYLSEHFRRSSIAHAGVCERAAAAYLRPWQTFLPPDDFTRAMAVSPLLAVFTYAVAGNTWRLPGTLHNPLHAGILRSLTRRMHREAVRLPERGMRCSA